MYAETFNVGSWLEPQAKWLRWALQTTTPGKLKDADYNLKQFWKALEDAKKQARTALQWAEVMTLDAQSQWCLGNYYGWLISDGLSTQNDGNAAQYLALLIPYVGPALAARGYLTKEEAAAAQPQLIQKKNEAYKLAESINAQAVKAYEQAKAQAATAAQKDALNQNQAKNGSVVFPNSIKAQTGADASAIATQQRIDTSLKKSALDTMKDIASMQFLNMPLWVWAAGAVTLILLLPKPTPTIQLGGSRQ